MENDLTEKIIGAALEVHSHLGPGLLESTYEACLAHELKLRNIPFERQKSFQLNYKGEMLNEIGRIDFIIKNEVVIELKSVEAFSHVHVAQLLTYLRLTDTRIGLLINFNVPLLKHGIKRVTL